MIGGSVSVDWTNRYAFSRGVVVISEIRRCWAGGKTGLISCECEIRGRTSSNASESSRVIVVKIGRSPWAF